MSPQKSRQQRRLACNRCRTYKLRCERDARHADGSCERCRKTGAACTTTTTTTTTPTSTTSPASARMNANNDFGNNTRPLSRLAPAPHGGSSANNVPRPMRGPQPTDDPADPPAARSEDADAGTQRGSLEDSPARVRSPPLDFNLSCFIPSDAGLEARAGPDKPHHVGWQGFPESSLGDVAGFDDSYMDLVFPRADPLSQSLGLIDAAHPANPGPRQPKHDWRGHLATPTSLIEVAGSEDSYAHAVSPQGHDDGEGGADVPRNHLGDVLELSRRLSQDDESLDTVPNPVETAVQRALDRSSNFCELLKSIIAGLPSTSSPVSSTNRGNPQSTSPACCALFATSLVTAYILLVRNWHRIFVHLHQILLAIPPQLDEMKNGGLAIMPMLQLGGLRVQGSPATQVAVLIELSFDMLGQVETGLGLGCWGVNKTRQGSTGGPQQPGHVVQGPVAISIRDMLLTQESVRLDGGPGGLDALPLADLAAQLKSRLWEREQP